MDLRPLLRIMIVVVGYMENGSYNRRMSSSCRTSRSNERLMNAARIIAMFGGFWRSTNTLLPTATLPARVNADDGSVVFVFAVILLFTNRRRQFLFPFRFFRVMFVYMSEKCGSLRIHSHIVVVWNMCSMKERDRLGERVSRRGAYSEKINDNNNNNNNNIRTIFVVQQKSFTHKYGKTDKRTDGQTDIFTHAQ